MHEQTQLTDFDREALQEVENYCYAEHSDLTPWTLLGFTDEHREKLATDDKGRCIIEFHDIYITEREEPDIWYVAATIYFKQDDGEWWQGSTDIYEAVREYTDEKESGALFGVWVVQWYAE